MLAFASIYTYIYIHDILVLIIYIRMIYWRIIYWANYCWCWLVLTPTCLATRYKVSNSVEGSFRQCWCQNQITFSNEFMHQNSFLNLVNFNHIWIVITVFLLMWHIKLNSVWCQIHRKSVITMQVWFDLTSFREKLFVCSWICQKTHRLWSPIKKAGMHRNK